MVTECAFIYPSDAAANFRKCRRIAGRGQKFCPGHRARPRRRSQDEPGPELFAFAGRLRTMTIEDLLDALSASLVEIQPLIERKSSRAARDSFTRANIAVTIALDRLAVVFSGYAALSQTPSSAAATPSLDQAAAGLAPPEDLLAMCDQLIAHLSPQ